MKSALYTLLLSALYIIALSGCGGSSSGDSSGSSSSISGGGGCQWHGNCSTTAKEGAYDCSGNTLMKCVNSQWQTIKYCGSLTDSHGYSCTCKGGCGTTTVECSYAFNVCGGYQFQQNAPELINWYPAADQGAVK